MGGYFDQRRQRRRQARRFRELATCPDCRHPWGEHRGSGNDSDGMCGECAYEFEHDQRDTSAPGCQRSVPDPIRAIWSGESLGNVPSDLDLAAIEARCAAASRGPWESFVEGRDHLSGDDFIRVGGEAGDDLDMYVSRAEAGVVRPASAADLDFIAAARQDVPALVEEVRRLRADQKS